MTTITDIGDWLDEQQGTKDVEIKRSHDEGELYVSATVHLAGLDLHSLHDEFDVEVRSAFHDPSQNRLMYAIWPR